jgi:manganese/iron transport system permease protein
MILLWQMAALLSGASTGLLGVYLVGLRMPFLAVGMAHAAMAGAVFGYLLGWPPTLPALAFALVAGWAMAWLVTANVRADLGTLSSILLSLTMGLAFLGIGLNRGDMTPLLSLMWGSLLFVRPHDLVLMLAFLLVLGGFVALCRRPLEAILFSRPLARACGIRERPMLILFMLLAGLIITLNLQIIGGLMMYSLLTNPAAAAYELGGSMRAVRTWSLALGLASTLCGFWCSWPVLCWYRPCSTRERCFG